MEKKILLIANDKSFMANTAARGLEKRGYSVARAPWNAPAITQAGESDPGALVCYLGDADLSDTAALTAAAALARSANIPLFEIGNDQETAAAAAGIPAELVREVYGRPLDTQRLADALSGLFEGASAAQTAARRTILVVDDDGTMLRMIKTWLEARYSVYMAGGGRAALDFLNTRRVDLILLDYRMPEMDGTEVLKALREREETREIPVIFLTGKNDEEELAALWLLGPAGVLVKSMPKEQLIGEIGRFFQKRGSET